ncbi:MAG: hypothetical protein ABSG37_00310 [Candidatus Limnocylindrales bacterium]|jgi:hypothetical protein
MFELLLQADRALADGLLDEAERTYWQLIESDPTNAIAIGGLARVFLERGDERLASKFASQAIDLDPGCVFARQVIETLERRAGAPAGSVPPEPAGHELPELPLRAAERLEAIGRQRRNGRPRSGEAAAAETVEDDEAGEAWSTGSAPDRESLARTVPGRVGPRSARAREPSRPRNKRHHAMPIGWQSVEPDGSRAQPPDAFAEAEMAAAVEAIGAMGDSGANEAAGAPDTVPAEAGELRGPGDALRETDAQAAAGDGKVAAVAAGAEASDAAEEPHGVTAGTSPGPQSNETAATERGAVAPSRKRGWFQRFRGN